MLKMIAASSQSASEVASVYDDFHTPYLEAYNKEPYSKDYIPPVFEKYTRKEGSPKEHIKRFINKGGK